MVWENPPPGSGPLDFRHEQTQGQGVLLRRERVQRRAGVRGTAGGVASTGEHEPTVHLQKDREPRQDR